MRLAVFSSVTVFTILLSSPGFAAQSAKQRETEGEFVSYHTHRDARFGHDHAYPDRGSIVHELSKSAVVVNYAGVAYRFHDGVWYEPRGSAFMVVAPPIGLIVSTLPKFSTVLARGGKTFLYGNDIFYLPRPDVGGYEIVNDPDDAIPETTGGAAPAAAVPIPAVASPSWDGSALKTMETGIPAAAGGGTAVAAMSTPAGSAPSGSIVASAIPLPPNTTTATPLSTAPAAGESAGASGAAFGTGAASGEAAESTKANSQIYPKNGQTPEQQARDRYECYRFGVSQSGFDPMRAASSAGTAVKANAQSEFERAQSVCLDAHGYAVR